MIEGKVSLAAAHEADYGVALETASPAFVIDPAATAQLRDELRAGATDTGND